MNKIFISCKESRIENNRSFYGCFYLGPFEASQSLTVANALRRTLLSECTGLGITSVIIENVHHEYSTLPNVRDSVLDILLNLKEIVLKKVSNPWNFYQNKGLNSLYEEVGSSFFKPVMGYLKVKGPGVIRAKNLRLPPFIQCVDPDQYIATLTDDGILNMKFIIMEGKNFFVQKSNSYLDFSGEAVKKREILLKELKDLLNSNNKKFESTQYQWGLPRRKNDYKTRKNKSSFGRNPKDFKNASILNIDAIFNPVTKVNYILEVAENMLVNNAIEKSMFVDDLTSLISSNNVLKTNFPFLKTAFAVPLEQTKNNLGQSDDNETFSSYQALTLEGTQKKGDPVGLSPFMKGLLEYLDNFSTSEYGNMYNSLHPLRKGGSKHNIILEIWTNGSMHPRDALSNAFFNLSFLFSNFHKTKILNPIYRNEFSFKNSLNLLNGGYDHKDINQKDSFYPISGQGTDIGALSAKQSSFADTHNQNLNYDIRILNLSLRTYAKLKRANINTIYDLSAMTENSLLNIVDKKSLTEIKRSFVDLGLNFSKDF